MAAALRTFIGLVTVAVVAKTVLGADHVVGGAAGWNLGSDFDTWASSQSFKPGDTLTFTYGTLHSVVEVTKADYDACSTNSPIAMLSDGNSVITLSSPRKRYFICGTSAHCSSGMKVEINTVSAAPTIPSPATPGTPPAVAPPTKLPEAPAAAPPTKLPEAPAAAPPTQRSKAPAPPTKLPEAPAAAPPTQRSKAPAATPPTQLSEAPAAAPSLDAPSTGDSPRRAPAMAPTKSPSVAQSSDSPSIEPPPKPSAANRAGPLMKIRLGLAATTLMALMF